MKLCSGKYNHTINILIQNFGPELDILGPDEKNDQVPRGLYADFLAKNVFMDKIENMKKRCKFTWNSSIGEYHPENDSYSGCIGMISQSKADLMIRPLDYAVNSRFVDFSPIIYSTRIVPFQILKNRNTAHERTQARSLIEIYNFLLPFTDWTLLFLAILFVHFAARRLIARVAFLKRIQINSQIKILSLFFIFCMFFMRTFFGSNIKTEHVLCDLSELLYTEKQVLTTTREPCFTENGLEMDYFRQSPKETLASKIYAKVNERNLCLSFEHGRVGTVLKRNFYEVYFPIYEDLAHHYHRSAHTMVKSDTFVGQVCLVELLKTMIYSKKMKKEIRRLVDTVIEAMVTFGFAKSLLKKMPNLSSYKWIHEGEHTGYNSVQSFIKDNTSIEPLSLDKLNLLFKGYFIILALLLLIFTIHFLCIYLSSKWPAMHELIREFTQNVLTLFSRNKNKIKSLLLSSWMSCGNRMKTIVRQKAQRCVFWKKN